jgi:hypothetical protein
LVTFHLTVEFRDREAVFLPGTPALDFERGENDPQPVQDVEQ